MSLAEIQATFVCIRDEELHVVYHDHLNDVTGRLYKNPFRGTVDIEIRAASLNASLATAERRAYAVLAMCEWIRRVQKGEVK